MSLLLLALSPAHAYELTGYVRTDPHFQLYMEQDQIQGTWRHTGIQEAVDRFNQNAAYGSIELEWDTNATFDTDNGISELYFLSDANMDTWCGTSSDVACTVYDVYVLDGAVVLDAADVFFADSTDWDVDLDTADITPYGGTQRPLLTTALHEFGHAMGLAHEDEVYNVMGQDWDYLVSNSDAYVAQMGEDATSGLAEMYGYSSGDYEDLSVAHWRWTGASGEYSTHDRTRLFSPASTALSPTELAFYGRAYTVDKGQYVYAEFTPENNGAETQYTTTRFYWSTNAWISSSDTSLGSSSFTAYANSPTTLKSGALRIPTTATSGTVYYIGAIIDSAGTLAEVDEDNNAAFLFAVQVR